MLTEDDEGLFRGVGVDLWFRVSAVVDLVGDVGNAAQDGEVDQTPCPLDGPPEFARLLRWGRRRIRVLALELTGDRLCPSGQGSSRGEGSE